MKERRMESKTYIVYADCDCGGEYKWNGLVLTSNPPQYPNICNKCGDRINVSGAYPATITVPEKIVGSGS